MKYIKTYERINIRNIKIGDYILSNFIYGAAIGGDHYWPNYINNSIGQVVNIYNKVIVTKYLVPESIYNEMFDNVDNRRYIYIENNNYYIDMSFNRDNIKYFSSNKEELELKLAANKYNV